MISNDEKVRTAIAEQAGQWLVANDAGALDARQSADLAMWLTASPVHIEEFLGVSVLARDLGELNSDPEYSLAVVVERARVEGRSSMPSLWLRVLAGIRGIAAQRWQAATLTMAAVGALSLGLLALWDFRPVGRVAAPAGVAALHLATRHGEQQTHRLADNSVLHMNTDSAVTILFNQNERHVILSSGEADFEVAHEPKRVFRVSAGGAQVVAVGTNFNVRLVHDATVVTVVEGRVAIGPSEPLEGRGKSSEGIPPRFVLLSADQQLNVVAGEWPPTPIAVDPRRTTAWLHREITFEREPLERVAAELNRYAQKPIEITTPALKNLEISGAFDTDDSEAFIAFLRSLDGVRVEVTTTRIRVSQGGK